MVDSLTNAFRKVSIVSNCYRNTELGRLAISVIEEDEPGAAKLIELFESGGKSVKDVREFARWMLSEFSSSSGWNVATLAKTMDTLEYILARMCTLVAHCMKQGWIEKC